MERLKCGTGQCGINEDRTPTWNLTWTTSYDKIPLQKVSNDVKWKTQSKEQNLWNKVSPSRDVSLLARRRVLLPGELRCKYAMLQTTTDDDDRRQRPLLVFPLYTICRRASNNTWTVYSVVNNVMGVSNNFKIGEAACRLECGRRPALCRHVDVRTEIEQYRCHTL